MYCEEMNPKKLKKITSPNTKSYDTEMVSHSSYIPQKISDYVLIKILHLNYEPPVILNRTLMFPENSIREHHNPLVECWSGTTRPLQPRQPGSTPGHFAIFDTYQFTKEASNGY